MIERVRSEGPRGKCVLVRQGETAAVGKEIDEEKSLLRRAVRAGAKLLRIVNVVFAADDGARQRNDDGWSAEKDVGTRPVSDPGAILVTHDIPP